MARPTRRHVTDADILRNRATADDLDDRIAGHHKQAIKASLREMSMEDSFTSDSALVASAAYDADRRMLSVVLKTGKGGHTLKTFQHHGFPAQEWERFKLAESKGAFYNSTVKALYPGKAA